MSIFQNVNWVASLVVIVSLVVTFAIVNVRLRLSLLRREAKQLSQDVQCLTTWAEDRRLSQLDFATKKDEQSQVDDDSLKRNVGDWIVRHPDGTPSGTATAIFARYYRPAWLRMA